jgi:serine phosphatase RsbU (regulator of sigma subunit)
MDMVLCAYNTKTGELQFAGAHNSLILIRNNELIEYKGDRMPIGIHRKEKDFTNNIIKIEKGDKVYIYSDGFQDQIGGAENKKYKAKNFKQLLLETSKYDVQTQKQKIEQEYEQWKVNYKQIDDIVILGIVF